MRVFISGMVNIETTVAVESFPVEYYPSRFNFFGNYSNVSGVGMNLALSFNALQCTTDLYAFTGDDLLANLIQQHLKSININTDFVYRSLKETMQSVILYDPSGKRSMFTDLKDWQELQVDATKILKQAAKSDIAMLTNCNISRQLLAGIKALQIPIVTDVHDLADIFDPYNLQFLQNADVIFISNEAFIGNEQQMLQSLSEHYPMQIIVCGMGGNGALMWTRSDHRFYHAPAVTPREIVNTVGAGDALCASFSMLWASGLSPQQALDKAVYFAGWKIGEKGAGSGYLSLAELNKI